MKKNKKQPTSETFEKQKNDTVVEKFAKNKKSIVKTDLVSSSCWCNTIFV